MKNAFKDRKRNEKIKKKKIRINGKIILRNPQYLNGSNFNRIEFPIII